MTKDVGLIGHPLKRRHSQVMHNAAFEHFSIDARYQLRDLEVEELAAFVRDARTNDWFGFQVTAPYKVLIMEYLDDIEDGARRIGAVNSVRRREDGALIGFNTDAPGFRRAAEAELGVRFLGIRAAVAGAGGVARAVVDVLVVAGAESVVVCDLVPERAAELAADAGDTVRAVALGTGFEECLGQVDLAVNATTVGMIQEGVPFDPTVLPESAVVYDLVYTPPETELVRRARGLGLPATNGLGTLVAQAEIAFELWTGIPDAAPFMRAALVSMPEGGASGVA